MNNVYGVDFKKLLLGVCWSLVCELLGRVMLHIIRVLFDLLLSI